MHWNVTWLHMDQRWKWFPVPAAQSRFSGSIPDFVGWGCSPIQDSRFLHRNRIKEVRVVIRIITVLHRCNYYKKYNYNIM